MNAWSTERYELHYFEYFGRAMSRVPRKCINTTRSMKTTNPSHAPHEQSRSWRLTSKKSSDDALQPVRPHYQVGRDHFLLAPLPHQHQRRSLSTVLPRNGKHLLTRHARQDLAAVSQGCSPQRVVQTQEAQAEHGMPERFTFSAVVDARGLACREQSLFDYALRAGERARWEETVRFVSRSQPKAGRKTTYHCCWYVEERNTTRFRSSFVHFLLPDTCCFIARLK